MGNNKWWGNFPLFDVQSPALKYRNTKEPLRVKKYIILALFFKHSCLSCINNETLIRFLEGIQRETL